MSLRLLQSSMFLLSLVLLLLNDFILKYQYPSWGTGKLSDFAGLFVFTLFWMVFLPKFRTTIMWLTALGFLWWKSPLANTFISIWNTLPLFSIDRVIDYSDYIALIMIPLAGYYARCKFEVVKLSPTLIALCSVFAFCATSVPRPNFYQYPNPQLLVFDCTIDSLAAYEHKTSTYDFEQDSAGFYRWVRSRYYGEFIPEEKLIGDSILLIKFDRFDRPFKIGHEHKKSTKVCMLDQIRKTRKQLATHFLEGLRERYTVALEPIEFMLTDSQPKPDFIQVLRYPLDLNTKDSFSILTDQFGALEKFNFKNSLLHGPYTQYWDSTQIAKQGVYESGLEQGDWTYYTAGGLKEKVEFYSDGELKKTTYFEPENSWVENNPLTKNRIVFIHGIVSIIFMLLFMGSVYFFQKWFAPKPVLSKDGNVLVAAIIRFGISAVLSFVAAFATFFSLMLMASLLDAVDWDMYIGLDGLMILMVTFFVIPFLYLITTARYLDTIWLIIWQVFGFIVVAEICYFMSWLM